MLVYAKIVDNIRKLFGNYSGNFPTNDDRELSYTDENGVAIELVPGDTYIDGGSSDGIQRVKRLSDNTEIVVSIDDEVIIGEKSTPPTPSAYLTFSSDSQFTLGVADGLHNDGTIEYSLDAEAWAQWDGSDISSFNEAIYLRGIGNTAMFDLQADAATVFVLSPVDNNLIYCTGNIESLLDYATVGSNQHPQMSENCFLALFANCTALATAPELPATTLANSCYGQMFYGCTSLTTPPNLPATELAIDCYCDMFNGCTSLTEAPELPATTLIDSCYSSMFRGCTSLTVAPELPATTLAVRCYDAMFRNCTSLATAPVLPATTLADSCYVNMFNGCTSIKLSETQTAEYTEPYRIPASGTGTTATDALDYMFTNTGGTFTGFPTINTTYYMAVS